MNGGFPPTLHCRNDRVKRLGIRSFRVILQFGSSRWNYVLRCFFNHFLLHGWRNGRWEAHWSRGSRRIRNKGLIDFVFNDFERRTTG